MKKRKRTPMKVKTYRGKYSFKEGGVTNARKDVRMMRRRFPGLHMTAPK